jgi:hypothetical protein
MTGNMDVPLATMESLVCAPQAMRDAATAIPMIDFKLDIFCASHSLAYGRSHLTPGITRAHIQRS